MSAQHQDAADRYTYEGAELDVFALAANWKSYWASRIAPHVGSRVLEVGAGLGATARVLCSDQTAWVALEPDPALARRMQDAIRDGELPPVCDVRVGTLENVAASELFDTILYIDVLEHIEDDCAELTRASSHLVPGGQVIVLAPAHQFLYTPFDKAIGHFRRYDRRMIGALKPSGLRLSRFEYLDSFGFLASLGNRCLLQSSNPSAAQIKAWDGLMVPVSRYLDPVLGRRFGKSVLAIWTRD